MPNKRGTQNERTNIRTTIDKVLLGNLGRKGFPERPRIGRTDGLNDSESVAVSDDDGDARKKMEDAEGRLKIAIPAMVGWHCLKRKEKKKRKRKLSEERGTRKSYSPPKVSTLVEGQDSDESLAFA